MVKVTDVVRVSRMSYFFSLPDRPVVAVSDKALSSMRMNLLITVDTPHCWW